MNIQQLAHDIPSTIQLIPNPTTVLHPHGAILSTLETKTFILSAAVLNQSLNLPGVVKLLNYTYDQSHINARDGRLLPPDPTTRLQSLSQLSSELEPDGFTTLMFSSEVSPEKDVEGLVADEETGATLIATASAKPYVETQLEGKQLREKTHLLFKRPPPDRSEPKADTDGRGDEEDKDRPKWEILAMAVHPTLQGRGLASTLLEQVITEIKSRASASIARPTAPRHRQDSLDRAGHPETLDRKGKAAKGKVMLMLSTMLEMNEAYYLKRGFITTAVRRFGPGTLGSRDGVSVAEMMQWVDL